MLVVLLVATVLGAYKGVAWQIASVSALVVSYLVALRFGDSVAPYISAEAPWNRFVGMLVLYLATSLVIWLLFRVVAGIIDRIKLREFDRQLGGLVGLVKGVLLCVVITFFVVTLSQQGRELVLQSRSGYYIAVLIDRAEPIMPEEAHQLLGPYLQELHDKLDHEHVETTPDGSRGGGAKESLATEAVQELFR